MAATIPDEILLTIFSHLPTGARLTCLRVCTQWRRIGLDRALWPPFGSRGGEMNRLRTAILLASACATPSDTSRNAQAPVTLDITLLVDHRDVGLKSLAKTWLRSGALENVVGSLVMKDTGANNAAIVLEALHGARLHRLEWEDVLDKATLAKHLPALTGLDELVIANKRATGEDIDKLPKRDRALFHTLLKCATERWSLTFDPAGGYLLADIPPKASPCQLHTFCLTKKYDVLRSVPGLFSVENFPNLRRLIGCIETEEKLFGAAGASPNLEELSVTVTLAHHDETQPLTGVYPRLKRLVLHDDRSPRDTTRNKRLVPFTNAAAQFPLLEEVISVPHHYMGREVNLDWWETALNQSTGLPSLRSISLSLDDPVRHNLTSFGKRFPAPVALAKGESVSHELAPGVKLTITLAKDADREVADRLYHYRAEREKSV